VKQRANAGEKSMAIEKYRQIHNVVCKQANDAVEALADLPRSRAKTTTVALSPKTR